MPASENGPGKADKALGMDQSISRRDFLNSTLLASGGLLMTSVSPMQLLGEDDDWTGYGGVGDYSGFQWQHSRSVDRRPSHPRRRV